MSASFEDTNNRSFIGSNGFLSRLKNRSFNRKSLGSGIDIGFQKSGCKSLSSGSVIHSYLDIPFDSNNGYTSNSIDTDSIWSSSGVDEDITLIDYKKFHGDFSTNNSIAKGSPPRWQMPFLPNEATLRRTNFENFENISLRNQKFRYVGSQRISFRRLSGLKNKKDFQNIAQDSISIQESKEKNIGELLEDWPP